MDHTVLPATHTNPQMERTIFVFTFQPLGFAVLSPLLISHAAEGRRPS